MNLYDISVFLREHNNYEILTHNYPDGDTLGSGYALCIALQQLGKNARVITAKLPPKFEYLTEGYRRLHHKYRCCGRQSFSPQYGKISR